MWWLLYTETLTVFRCFSLLAFLHQVYFSIFTELITEVSSAERGHEGGSVGAASILCNLRLASSYAFLGLSL
jgi:hypothetical protein